MFSEKDRYFMKVALKEARKTFKKGDFPVGVVLVINGKIVDMGVNDNISEGNWISHAETKIINKNSTLIKNKSDNGSAIELYTTLEPCLMCFGVLVHHRLSRIVYACPDPNAGSTHINPNKLKGLYKKIWPKISGGLMKEESYKLMMKFWKADKERWKKNNADLFEKMYSTWK